MKPAISTLIYQLLPAIRLTFILSKNNWGALSQFPNRTILSTCHSNAPPEMIFQGYAV
ncbi:MAG: hypothetical protein OZ917_07825 [Candidatus Brocadiaceae bacterium]|nr:hypothetical protein [Candidatus Brocadiaceae bacterium]